MLLATDHLGRRYMIGEPYGGLRRCSRKTCNGVATYLVDYAHYRRGDALCHPHMRAVADQPFVGYVHAGLESLRPGYQEIPA